HYLLRDLTGSGHLDAVDTRRGYPRPAIPDRPPRPGRGHGPKHVPVGSTVRSAETPIASRASDLVNNRIGHRRATNPMKKLPIPAILMALLFLALPGCDTHEEKSEPEEHKIVVTNPKVKDVTITQQYVCQIRSRRNIEVNAMVSGYLDEIPVKEGDPVKKGEVMFKIVPILYKA